MRKPLTGNSTSPGWMKKILGGLMVLCVLVLIGTGVFCNDEVPRDYTGGAGRSESGVAATGEIPDTTYLLAWYSMEEMDSSSVRTDAHGSNDYGNIFAAADGAAQGLQGNAIQLGNGHFRTVDDSTDFPLDVTQDFTIVTWVYNPSGASGDPYLWRTGGGPANVRIQARLGNPDYALITRTETGAEYLINSNDFAFDTWQMVTLRHQASTNSVQLGVDLNTAAADTFATPLIGPMASETRIQGNGASILLDEQSVWQAYLNNDELAWLFNSGAGRAYSDLMPASP